MSFVSYGFPLFVGALLGVYCLLPQKKRWWALLIGSWGFYALAGVSCLPFLALTTGTVYLGGLQLGRMGEREKSYLSAHKELTKEEKKTVKARGKARRRRVFLSVLLLNLGILAGCKYFGLFAKVSGGILLPVGLSFYMFQGLGYLIDVQRGKYPPEKHFFRFALFISFFPQLMQGPISRYDSLSKTLYAGTRPTWDMGEKGLLRMLWGYFKKLVIADRLTEAVAACFSLTAPSGAVTALGMGLYAIRLLCDFTGGIDIALGAASLFGVAPMENFHAPYLSKGLAEYWNRWHISMGSWFRDYIFYPLSISKPMLKLNTALRRKYREGFFTRLPLYMAILVTWLATGLWHGSGWNYALWGLSNGLLLILSQELEPLYAAFRNRHPRLEKSGAFGIFRILRTFMLLCCLRLWDVFSTPAGTINAFLSLFLYPNFGALMSLWPSLNLGAFDLWVLGLGLIPVAVLDIRQDRGKSLYPKSSGIRWLCIGLLLLLVLTLGVYGMGYTAADFIYGRF